MPMLKEILSQPDAIRNVLRGRIDATKGVTLEYEIGPIEVFRPMKHVILVGGTSSRARLVGKFFIEHFADVQVDDYSTELRDSARLENSTLCIALADSGKTAETLEAVCDAREKGAFVLMVCDTTASRVARLADSVLCIRAGSDPDVVSTNAFSTQMAVFYLLGLFLASSRGVMTSDEIRVRARLLSRIPEQLERVFDNCTAIEALAERFSTCAQAIVTGGGIHFPVALEGAFKLNETSCIRAEAYPPSEIKRIPITLGDNTTWLVALAPRDHHCRTTLSSIQNFRTRELLLLGIGTEGDCDVSTTANYVLKIPEADTYSNPFLTVVPLQLFAYYIRQIRGIEAMWSGG